MQDDAYFIELRKRCKILSEMIPIMDGVQAMVNRGLNKKISKNYPGEMLRKQYKDCLDWSMKGGSFPKNQDTIKVFLMMGEEDLKSINIDVINDFSEIFHNVLLGQHSKLIDDAISKAIKKYGKKLEWSDVIKFI